MRNAEIKRSEYYQKITALNYCHPRSFVKNFNSVEAEVETAWNRKCQRSKPTWQECQSMDYLRMELDTVWAYRMLNMDICRNTAALAGIENYSSIKIA